VPSQGAKALYEGGETPALTVLHRTRSPKLSGIVAKTNTKSINLYAEAMLKMVGKQQLGEGSTAKGIEAVAAHWRQAGLDMEGFVMEDGSGLSRFNAVTPRQLAEILRTARTAPWFGDLEASLAVAGETGTLRNLCKGQAAAGRIVGKSGYINRVRCYVGYARTYQGRTLAFAIMANNFTGPYRGLTPAFERFFNTLVQVSW
jgi:D-alanyl-D-alanine carboxypeptidase/D-alanyl-D-alanine-endopeptidase (penicillin-binding protein 4)